LLKVYLLPVLIELKACFVLRSTLRATVRWLRIQGCCNHTYGRAERQHQHSHASGECARAALIGPLVTRFSHDF
jgi:hypothetical protein